MDTDRVGVMIVDDQEAVRKKLASIVEANPLMLLTGLAGNGYEAVALVAKNRPDVILMDIEMESKLAGVYAAREILRSAPEIKIIIHSQHDKDYYVAKAFQFGASDYLIKGAGAQDITDTILSAHKRRCGVHPEAAAYLRSEFVKLKNAQENLAYTMQVILRLTQTELDILHMLYSGMKMQEIAKVRFVEITTMKTHMSNIIRKFDRSSIAEVLETVESTGFFLLTREPE